MVGTLRFGLWNEMEGLVALPPLFNEMRPSPHRLVA
jgi:hypothetical protein